MNSEPDVPLSLKVVAALFIIGGIFAAFEIFVSLLNQRFNIPFGVLGLFIGPGLLALRPRWRTCALVLLCIAMVGVPIITLYMMVQSGPLYFIMFGLRVGNASKGFGLLFSSAMFALAVWQYRVLVRPDVRTLFVRPE